MNPQPQTDGPTQPENQIAILVIDDFSAESIRTPFKRLGIIQENLCRFHFAETLVDGKCLIDEMCKTVNLPAAGIAFLDMSFEADKILPSRETGASLEAVLQSLEHVFGYTPGMPLRNGGVWLLHSLLSSQLRQRVFPVLYSARTDLTDMLEPLSETVQFRILTQIPAEFQLIALLDSLTVILSRQGVVVDYPTIRNCVAECLREESTLSTTIQHLGESLSQGASPWRLQHLFPQVFGRARRKLKKSDAVASALAPELFHLLRLASGAHQGILLKQLFAQEEGFECERRGSLAFLYNNGECVDNEQLVKGQILLDAFSPLLNSDTANRLQVVINMLTQRVEKQLVRSDRLTLFQTLDLLNLQELSQDVVRQMMSTSPSAMTLWYEGQCLPQPEWQQKIATSLRGRIADRILVNDILHELLIALLPLITLSTARIEFYGGGNTATFRITWDNVLKKLVCPEDVSVRRRGLQSILGIRTSISSQVGGDFIHFAPYGDHTPKILCDEINPKGNSCIVLHFSVEV